MREDEPQLVSRILVVEDDAFIGMLYADTLAAMGHGVCAIAATERDAVVAAEEHKPDFMIVDSSLAEGSGMAAVSEILRGGFVPHLFVSGDVAGILTLMPGANILEKPFLPTDLAKAIQRVLATAPQI